MPKVSAAFGAVGQIAELALREQTKTQSPSRLFEDLGYYQPQGFALGIEKGTPLVERAITGMVGTGGEMAQPPKAGRRGGSFVVENLVVNVNGQASDEDLVSKIKGGITQALEDAVLELGLDLEPAT